MNFPLSSVSATGPVLTYSQALALEQLVALAELHFANNDYGPIRLRTLPLVIGPSGVGKTHLLRELGQKLHLPVFKITVGDWIVQGARADATTYRRLCRELDRDAPFILHIDELDKFMLTPDPWTRALFGEIFGVLDGTPGPVTATAAHGGWTDALVARLRSKTFIVGSGTWQSLWIKQHRSVGFCRGHQPSAPEDHEQLRARIRSAELIPAELLNRFNGSWLFLDPLSQEDFSRIGAQLNLSPAILDPAKAEASGLNFRYVENVFTDSVVTHHLRQRESNCPCGTPSTSRLSPEPLAGDERF